MSDVPLRRALVSVTDKEGLPAFAAGLARRGVELLSTGGTAAVLRGAGVPVTDVAEVTGFPEILGGRVKTLHPLLYGGILARPDRPGDRADMERHGIHPIDLVVVNLYRFVEAAEAGMPVAEAMERVDIGGPCMIRAAAKNHVRVAVVVDPADYGPVLEELEARDGALGAATRLRLAAKAFGLCAAYDAAIQAYLSGARPGAGLPERFAVPAGRGRALRYGENPHQAACFYPIRPFREACAAGAVQRGGKPLSYNNILDTDAAFELVKEFDPPAAVVVKHCNPCGAAEGRDLLEAFTRAWAGDPLSAFGGIAAFNRPVDTALAEVIADPERFLEVVVAPAFSGEAVEILKTRVRWGRNLRILESGPLEGRPVEKGALAFRSVTGGVLVQERDLGFDREEERVVTRREPDGATLETLRFAWKVVKHVRSNAVLLAREGAVVGVGAGQMSRIDAARMAAWKAGDRAKGAVMASDAFFPFRDTVDLAAELGVKAIIQPGGSVRDKESIDAADQHGIPMVFTGVRHFRH